MAQDGTSQQQQMLRVAQMLANSGVPIKDVMGILGQSGRSGKSDDQLFAKYAPSFAELQGLPANDFHRSIARSVADGMPIWQIEQSINEATVAGGEGIDPNITAKSYIDYANGLKSEWQSYNTNQGSDANKSLLEQYGFTTSPSDQYTPEQLFAANPVAEQSFREYARNNPAVEKTYYTQGDGRGPLDAENNRGQMDSAMRQFANRASVRTPAVAGSVVSPVDTANVNEAAYNVAFKNFQTAVDNNDLTGMTSAGKILDAAKKKWDASKAAAKKEKSDRIDNINSAQGVIDFGKSKLFGLQANVSDARKAMSDDPLDDKTRAIWVQSQKALGDWMLKNGAEYKAAQDVVAAGGVGSTKVSDTTTAKGEVVRPKGFQASSYMAPKGVDNSATLVGTRLLSELANQMQQQGRSPFIDEMYSQAALRTFLKGK